MEFVLGLEMTRILCPEHSDTKGLARKCHMQRVVSTCLSGSGVFKLDHAAIKALKEGDVTGANVILSEAKGRVVAHRGRCTITKLEHSVHGAAEAHAAAGLVDAAVAADIMEAPDCSELDGSSSTPNSASTPCSPLFSSHSGWGVAHTHSPMHMMQAVGGEMRRPCSPDSRRRRCLCKQGGRRGGHGPQRQRN